MKFLSFICIMVALAFTSCKKEQIPTIYGNWLEVNGHWQFKINSLSGKGDNSFENTGKFKDTLIWRIAPNEYRFKILRVNPQTMTLKLNSDTLYFSRMY